MIFCLDTSGRETLLGLAKDQRVRELMLTDRDRLLSCFYELLDSMGAAPAEIAAIAIGKGPGSFTGLRVGFAFAHGLARGLDVPLWPVPSFDVLAHKVLPTSDTVTVLAQARKERWFAQCYGKTEKARVVLDAKELAQWLPLSGAICGPGCRSLPDELKVRLEDRIPAEEILHRPQADALIDLARTTWQHRERLAIGDVLPDYGLEFGAA
jgi:tRNA threonylcarbamoyl adenosine modification protein YeaZ